MFLSPCFMFFSQFRIRSLIVSFKLQSLSFKSNIQTILHPKIIDAFLFNQLLLPRAILHKMLGTNNNKNTMIQLELEHSHHHHHDQHSKKHTHEHTDDDNQSNLSSLPCHPHREVAAFDFSAIEQQIRIIKRKKQEARLAAEMAKKAKKDPHEIYEADVIEDAFEEAEEMVPVHVRVALKQRIKFIEDKVYLSAHNHNYGGFVSRIKQEVLNNQALANQLNLAMSQVELDIHNDIEEGIYQIHNIQHKPKFAPPQPEPAHRVKLKNMLIKSKILDLKEEFNKSQVTQEAMIRPLSISTSVVEKKQGEIWGDGFHLLSEGTKKAQQFIKRVQREQKQIRIQKQSKDHQLKSLEVKSAMEHKEFEEQMKKERHQTLRLRYQQGRSQKKVQKERREKEEKEYAQFLKQYRGKKPLFRLKEEQYLQNIVEEQQRRRKNKLMEIHQEKKPMTHQQLIEHQKNYQKWKRQKQQQMKAEKEAKRREEASLPRKSFYRGKFHSILKQQKEQLKKVVDPQEIRDALLKKQKQFGEMIRKKYAPLISEQKRKQLDEMMKGLQRGKNEKALSEQAYKQLGNDYLKELHKMIGELKAKGLIKPQQRQEQKVKPKNYLQAVRQKYNFSTIDYRSQLETNAQWVQNKASKLEKDAKMLQKVMRYKDQFDIEKHMRELDQINERYINAAEAKMTLISKLQGSNSNKAKSQRQSIVSSHHTNSKSEIQ